MKTRVASENMFVTRSSYYLIPSVLAAFLLATSRCVQSRTHAPADVCLGEGFEIDVLAAAIIKRFEQISDEDLNKK